MKNPSESLNPLPSVNQYNRSPTKTNDLCIRFMISVLLLIEAAWLSAGVTWLARFYQTCPVDQAKDIMLGEYQSVFKVCKHNIYTSLKFQNNCNCVYEYSQKLEEVIKCQKF